MSSSSDIPCLFQKMGAFIKERWARENKAQSLLPELAFKALQHFVPSSRANWKQIVKQYHFGHNRLDPDGSGKQTGLVVYEDKGFCIEIILGLDTLASINEHQFYGVFHLLSGRCLHTQWAFEDEQELDPLLYTGNTRMNRAEILEKGDSVIINGPQRGHALAGLEEPVFVLCVRSTRPLTHWRYLSPGIKIAELGHTREYSFCIQLFSFFTSVGPQKFSQHLCHYIRNAPPHAVFEVLSHFMMKLPKGCRGDVYQQAYRRFGCMFLTWLEAIREQDRIRRNLESVKHINQAEHRFLISLLSNLSHGFNIKHLIEQCYPGEAAQTVAGWLAELMSPSEGGGFKLLDVAIRPVKISNGEQLTDLLPNILIAVVQNALNGVGWHDQPRYLAHEFKARLDETSARDLSKEWSFLSNSFLQPILGIETEVRHKIAPFPAEHRSQPVPMADPFAGIARGKQLIDSGIGLEPFVAAHDRLFEQVFLRSSKEESCPKQ